MGGLPDLHFPVTIPYSIWSRHEWWQTVAKNVDTFWQLSLVTMQKYWHPRIGTYALNCYRLWRQGQSTSAPCTTFEDMFVSHRNKSQCSLHCSYLLHGCTELWKNTIAYYRKHSLVWVAMLNGNIAQFHRFKQLHFTCFNKVLENRNGETTAILHRNINIDLNFNVKIFLHFSMLFRRLIENACWVALPKKDQNT